MFGCLVKHLAVHVRWLSERLGSALVPAQLAVDARCCDGIAALVAAEWRRFAQRVPPPIRSREPDFVQLVQSNRQPDFAV